MGRIAYIFGLITLSVAIGTLNFFAYRGFWYWRFWWFDIIMHTLAGLLVGGLTLWLAFVWKRYERFPYRPSLAAALAFAAISVIGVGWELFEFGARDLVFLPQHDPWNTASDLFFDGVGCALAVLGFILIYNKRKT